MDKQVVDKLIKNDGRSCPDIKYENPLLDRSVAKSVSRSFLNILKKPNLNDLTRSLIQENIRKACKVEPPEHLSIDDDMTELLKGTYEEHIGEYNINKELDSFLIRNLKEVNINSIHHTSVKPDIVQALINLNGNQEKSDTLLKDVIYWNVDQDNQNHYLDILKPMWNMDYILRTQMQNEDVSIKMKPWIEKMLLLCVTEIIGSTIIIDERVWFYENSDLMQLIDICSVSNECFQISCSILNSLFIYTNFEKRLLNFIALFIDTIKKSKLYISQLYPPNLQHIVLLLDIELDNLDGEIKEKYITNTLKELRGLHKEYENNLIMLLSHFKNWFELYYNFHLSEVASNF